LLIGNTQTYAGETWQFLPDDHTAFNQRDGICWIDHHELTVAKNCELFRNNGARYCSAYRVFRRIKAQAKRGAKLGFYVPWDGRLTFWFHQRNILRGDLTNCHLHRPP
jgi:hypothetical protein